LPRKKGVITRKATAKGPFIASTSQDVFKGTPERKKSVRAPEVIKANLLLNSPGTRRERPPPQKKKKESGTRAFFNLSRRAFRGRKGLQKEDRIHGRIPRMENLSSCRKKDGFSSEEEGFFWGKKKSTRGVGDGRGGRRVR